MEIYNSTKGEKEKVSAILYVDGKKTTEAQEAKAGDIVALTKLKNTFLNDSLCAVGSDIQFEPIAFPAPVTAYAVEPKNKADADKIGQALHRATDEDPSIRLDHNTETHELVLWGMGDMHLEVTLEHIKNRSNVEMNHHTPHVAYKETITGSGEGHYKHKKQSGGRGQYGECYVRIRPKATEEDEWFLNKLVGGAIPATLFRPVKRDSLKVSVRVLWSALRSLTFRSSCMTVPITMLTLPKSPSRLRAHAPCMMRSKNQTRFCLSRS